MHVYTIHIFMYIIYVYMSVGSEVNKYYCNIHTMNHNVQNEATHKVVSRFFFFFLFFFLDIFFFF